jgi:hypothetical protein
MSRMGGIAALLIAGTGAGNIFSLILAGVISLISMIFALNIHHRLKRLERRVAKFSVSTKGTE